MLLRLVLLAAAGLLLSSCGQDKFDQRYRNAEAQIRQEDRDLASEMPSGDASGSAAVQPADPSSRPR
jgi:hypothetical protein